MLSLGQNCIYFNLFFKKQTHSCFDTTHQLFFTKNAEKLSKSLFTDRPLALNWVLCCVYLRSWETLAAAAGSTRRDTRWAEPSAQWEMPVSRPQFSTVFPDLFWAISPFGLQKFAKIANFLAKFRPFFAQFGPYFCHFLTPSTFFIAFLCDNGWKNWNFTNFFLKIP